MVVACGASLLRGAAYFYYETMRTYEVEYVVEGNGTTDITHQHNGETVSLRNEELPWKLTRNLRGIESIRLDAPDGGSCEIYIDGELCDREADARWCSCYDGVGDAN